MTPYFLLFFAFISFAVSAILSFSPAFSKSSYYIPISLLAGLISTGLWIALVRVLHDSNRLFWWSLAWDLSMVAAFYLIPIAFSMIKLNWNGIIGLTLVLVGLLFLKSSG